MLPCQGQLMIERSSDAGKRQVLGFLNAGNLLGLGSGDVFLYSVQSLIDCSVLRCRRDDFERLAARYPKLRDNLSAISSQVLVRMMDHLFAIGQKRAHERLAFLLWQLSLRQGETRATRVPLAMRRVDIGDYLGLTLETTSRAFTALRRAGIIDTSERYGVTILLPDRLAELASVS
jgi:CRP-like cAMP-binding protein